MQKLLRLVTGLAAAFVIVSLVALFPTPKAHAAPKTHTVLGDPIQNECAEGTPSLAQVYVNNTRYLFVAWTGCDNAHRLNIAGSINGLDDWETCGTICAKHTLQQSSYFDTGPSITSFNGNLYIAYDDPNQNIWVGYYNFTTSLQALTQQPESSFYRPALGTLTVYGQNRLYLAWTGTDPDHHLNSEFSYDGRSFTGKVTHIDTALGGPSLAAWPGKILNIYMAWRSKQADPKPCMGYIWGNVNLGGHTCLSDSATDEDVGLADDTAHNRMYIGYGGNDDVTGYAAERIAYTSDGTHFTIITLGNFYISGFGASLADFDPYMATAFTQTSSGGDHPFVQLHIKP